MSCVGIIQIFTWLSPVIRRYKELKAYNLVLVLSYKNHKKVFINMVLGYLYE